MARKTPMTRTFFIVNLLLTIFTGGGWLIVWIPWEIYKRS